MEIKGKDMRENLRASKEQPAEATVGGTVMRSGGGGLCLKNRNTRY